MPRRRKGSPQDSIDSILLAICRYEDIDHDTLAHYFDRLDEEWMEGAREKVLHLLRTNDVAAHSAAVLILSELATEFDLNDLEALIEDPAVSDIAKLTVSPVLKELGSSIADDEILQYLHDPEAAIQQMQTRLLELIGKSELGIESVLEDVLSMPLERRLSFISWLGQCQDERAVHLLIPLLESQSGKIAMAVLDALEQLGTLASQHTIPALNYCLAHSSNRQLKQRARTILGRLTMQTAPEIAESVATTTRLQPLPPYEARVSFIDGSGAQIVMMAWRRSDNLLKGVNVLSQDQWGIKDCYGTDEMDMHHWADFIKDMGEQGFSTFDVPMEYAHALVAEARALNKRTHRKLPIGYAVWRPFIEGEENTRPIQSMLEPLALTPELIQLAERGGELYNLPEFLSWMFDPFERIHPYVNRYLERTLLTSFASSNRRRGSKGKSKEQKVAIDDMVDEAIHELVDAKWRTLYEGRLRRQAALFAYAGRSQDADLVRAVAAVLHPNSSVPPEKQAFLRAMMRFSIEQGPIRMMAAALESAPFGTGPLDLLLDH